MEEVVALEDAPLRDQESETYPVPDQADELPRHLALLRILNARHLDEVAELAHASDAEQLHHPAGVVVERVNVHASDYLQRHFYQDGGNVVKYEHVPGLKYFRYRFEVEIGSLPQEDERPQQITDGEDIHSVGAGQEHDRHRDPQETRQDDPLDDVQVTSDVRDEIRYRIAEATVFSQMDDALVRATGVSFAGVSFFDAEDQRLSRNEEQHYEVADQLFG